MTPSTFGDVGVTFGQASATFGDFAASVTGIAPADAITAADAVAVAVWRTDADTTTPTDAVTSTVVPVVVGAFSAMPPTDSSNVITVGVPVGAIAGDLLIYMWLTRSGSTVAITGPSGWVMENSIRRGASGWFETFSRTLTQSDLDLGTTWSFTGGNSATPGHVVLAHAIRGYHPTTWKNGVGSSSASTTAFSCGAVTTTVDNCLLLRGGGTALSTGTALAFDWSAGNEMTDAYHGGPVPGSGGGGGSNWIAAPTAGASNLYPANISDQFDSTSRSWAGNIIAIAPAPGGTGLTTNITQTNTDTATTTDATTLAAATTTADTTTATDTTTLAAALPADDTLTPGDDTTTHITTTADDTAALTDATEAALALTAADTTTPADTTQRDTTTEALPDQELAINDAITAADAVILAVTTHTADTLTPVDAQTRNARTQASSEALPTDTHTRTTHAYPADTATPATQITNHEITTNLTTSITPLDGITHTIGFTTYDELTPTDTTTPVAYDITNASRNRITLTAARDAITTLTVANNHLTLPTATNTIRLRSHTTHITLTQPKAPDL